MKRETVVVLDFGGQYNQLVARRVRECNVYCEIYSYKTDLEKIKAMNPKGIILTGGPNSCYEADSPTCNKELFELGIPVLGLCYGAQLMMHVLGGKVEKADVSEYGKTEVLVDKTDSKIFKDVSDKTICWMSHTDYISQVAPGFEIAAHTADCPVATAQNEEKKLYAIQFHPEVLHTVEGKTMLSNFVLGVCGCAGDWKMDAFVEHTIREIREKVGDGKVLLALSGGVDSSVAAGLLSRAIGKQLTCVFVDHGLLRKDEGDEVEGVFGPNGQFDLNFIRVNAQQRYYDKLAGVTEPEAKRKIIGEEFIRIFEEEAKKIADEKGYVMKEDAGRGWRRVVASPMPVEIEELSAVKCLVDNGFVVVTVGGGGIPVIRNDKGELEGTAAVIDKDLASEKLAEDLDADALVILTAVEKVSINYKKPCLLYTSPSPRDA